MVVFGRYACHTRGLESGAVRAMQAGAGPSVCLASGRCGQTWRVFIPRQRCAGRVYFYRHHWRDIAMAWSRKRAKTTNGGDKAQSPFRRGPNRQ